MVQLRVLATLAEDHIWFPAPMLESINSSTDPHVHFISCAHTHTDTLTPHTREEVKNKDKSFKKEILVIIHGKELKLSDTKLYHWLILYKCEVGKAGWIVPFHRWEIDLYISAKESSSVCPGDTAYLFCHSSVQFFAHVLIDQFYFIQNPVISHLLCSYYLGSSHS